MGDTVLRHSGCEMQLQALKKHIPLLPSLNNVQVFTDRITCALK